MAQKSEYPVIKVRNVETNVDVPCDINEIVAKFGENLTSEQKADLKKRLKIRI